MVSPWSWSSGGACSPNEGLEESDTLLGIDEELIVGGELASHEFD